MNTCIKYVFLLTLFAACSDKKEEQKGGGAGKGPSAPVPVNVVVAMYSGSQDKITATGTVMADEEVELRSEVAGKITKIYFEEGSTVSKGQLLVKLDDRDLLAQLQKAQLNKKLFEEKESRQRKLLDIGAISREEYEGSLNELNVAKADISLLAAQQDKTEIRAPFSGTIGLKQVNEGGTITPSTLIASLQNLTPVKINFTVPEKYRQQIKKGDKITFTIEGMDKNFSAEIYAIEPRIDPATRTLQIRAVYSNPGKNVYPGSFAKIELPLENDSLSLMIPTHAVIPDIKGQKVFALKDGKAVQVHVETGIRTETQVQITSGISKGDTIITTGILQLKNGDAVVVKQLMNNI